MLDQTVYTPESNSPVIEHDFDTDLADQQADAVRSNVRALLDLADRPGTLR